MDYEVLNVGLGTPANPQVEVNGACANVGCPNLICPSVNLKCGSSPTEPDTNCPNVFPCANPGFGCRSLCGGAKGTNCVAPYSLG